MDPARAFVIAASDEAARTLRDALASREALVWSNGRLLAVRVAPDRVRELLGPLSNEYPIQIFGSELPKDVFDGLPRAAQMMVNAQQKPLPKEGPVISGRAWDSPGMQEPRHLKKQG
jgi:hypothetical protein